MPRTVDFLSITVVFVIGAGIGACSKDESCSCFNPYVGIVAAKGEVTAIESSGPACEGVTARCSDVADSEGAFRGGCESYTVIPHHAGECRIHVETKNAGTVDESRQIEDLRHEPCCGGFYVTPSANWKIAVGSQN